MNISTVENVREMLMEGLLPQYQFQHFLQNLEGTDFFAKTFDGKIVSVGKHILERNNMEYEEEILGLTDYDLYPSYIANKIFRDDSIVVQQKKSKLNIMEFCLNDIGIPEWNITNKYPLFNNSNDVIGTMGVTKKFEGKFIISSVDNRLLKSIEYIKGHLSENPSVETLAKISCMSLRSFERIFKSTFNYTPKQYILRTKVLASCTYMRKSEISSRDISRKLGFSTQSHFVQCFKKYIGITPHNFRSTVKIRLV